MLVNPFTRQVLNWSDEARKKSAEVRRLKAKKKGLDSALPLAGSLATFSGLSGTGALMTSKPENLIGLDTYYHGTSKEYADQIKKRGLRPSHGGKKGGTSAMGLTPNPLSFKGEWVEDPNRSKEWTQGSKGKIHITSRKSLAKMFADQQKHSGKKGAVVKITQSLADRSNLTQDPFFVGGEPAFTSRKVASPSRIAGSGSKLKRARLIKDILRGVKSPQYAKAALRSSGHIAFGLGALGLASYIGKQAISKMKESSKLAKEVKRLESELA